MILVLVWYCWGIIQGSRTVEECNEVTYATATHNRARRQMYFVCECRRKQILRLLGSICLALAFGHRSLLMSDPTFPTELMQMFTHVKQMRGTQVKMKAKIRELTMLVEEADMTCQSIQRTGELAKDALAAELTRLRNVAASSSPVLTGLPLSPGGAPPPPPPPAQLHPLLVQNPATAMACGQVNLGPAGSQGVIPPVHAVPPGPPTVPAPKTPPSRPTPSQAPREQHPGAALKKQLLQFLKAPAKSKKQLPFVMAQSKAAIVKNKQATKPAAGRPKPPSTPPPNWEPKTTKWVGKFAQNSYTRKRSHRDIYTPGQRGQGSVYDTNSEASSFWAWQDKYNRT